MTTTSDAHDHGHTHDHGHADAHGHDHDHDHAHKRSRRSAAVLAGLLVLCVGGGAVIGVAFAGSDDVYRDLSLPTWAPPSGLFGPVWTLLYSLMAVGAWLVWRTDAAHRRRALSAFALQLTLNFMWTPVFFGAGEPALALVVLVAVLLTAGWWVSETLRIHRLAAALQLPYLAWLTFATALNAAIWLAH